MVLEVNLISARTAWQGSYLEHKMDDAYFNECAYCELNTNDFNKLNINEGDRVKVTTDYGEVVVYAKINDDNPDKLGHIPMGPWSNAVLNPETHGCGMPGFKGVPAVIEPTDEKPLDLKSLMRSYCE